MAVKFSQLLPRGRGQRNDPELIDQGEAFDDRSRLVDIHRDDVAYIHMRISASAGTTVTTGTPTKLAGTTVTHDIKDWDMPVNNRIRYRGSVGKHFVLAANMTTTSDTNNTIVKFYYAKNGSIVETSEIQRKIGTAGDIGASSLFDFVDIEPRDYVEVWVDTDKNAVITVSLMNVLAFPLEAARR